MADEEAAAGPTDLRDKEAAELVCALDPTLDGVTILTKGRVGDGEAGLAESIADCSGIGPLGRVRERHRRQRWNDAMRVEDHVAVPVVGDEDGVLRAIGRDTGDLRGPAD